MPVFHRADCLDPALLGALPNLQSMRVPETLHPLVIDAVAFVPQQGMSAADAEARKLLLIC